MKKTYYIFFLICFSIQIFGQSIDTSVLKNVDENLIKEYLEQNASSEQASLDSPKQASLVEIDAAETYDPSRGALKFGFDFISTSPTNISASSDLPVPGNYKLSLNDELKVILSGTKQDIFSLKVQLDGSILFPELGSVFVQGETFAEAKKKLRNLVKNSYVGVDLDLSLTQLSAKKITIIGAVKKPGTYLVNPFTTISNVLAYSGGVNDYASLRTLKLIKPDGSHSMFDLYDLLILGDRSNDLTIETGDIVSVGATTNFVNLTGAVIRPMVYEFIVGEKFSDVLNFAMGTNNAADKNEVWVKSIKDDEKVTFKRSNDDILDASEIYEVYVGNKVSKLNEELFVFGDGVGNGFHNVSELENFPQLINKLTFSSEVFPFYALYEQYGQGGDVRKISTFSLLDPQTYENFVLEKNSRVVFFDRTSVLAANISTNDMVSIKIAGTSYSLPTKGMISPNDFLEYLGSLDSIDTDKVSVLTSSGTKLNSLYNIFSSEDLVSISFPPEKLDRINVTIYGEVSSPGIYELTRDSSLGELYKLAGGFKSNANQNAIFFSREELKQRERDTVKKAKEMLVDTLIAESKNDGANVGQIMQIIDLADNIEFSGRITGDFSEDSDIVSDFSLAEGDVIYVPPPSNTITVFGEVSNPSSYTYEAQKDYIHYVNLAGGYTDFSNKKGIYVIKANGETIRINSGYFRSNSYPEPGDIVVVPRDLSRFDLLPIVTSATQVISNIAFSASALNSLDR